MDVPAQDSTITVPSRGLKFPFLALSVAFVLVLVLLVGLFSLVNFFPSIPGLSILPRIGLFPLPLSHSLVQGAMINYRLVGTVEEASLQANGDMALELTATDGTPYSNAFVISAIRTLVTEKGKGFAGFSLSEIKRGDTIEVVYTVDLRTGQSLVTQAQVERGE